VGSLHDIRLEEFRIHHRELAKAAEAVEKAEAAKSERAKR